MVRGGVTYYYHYNGHGDVIALTDVNGTVAATYQYDAFGNHIGSTGSVVNPYRYAGYRWDAETGLYYLNARYYMPSVGRFITRDAFHGFEDDPASLNGYNYAHSNPIMFVDPSGYSVSLVLNLAMSALTLVGIMIKSNPWVLGGIAILAGVQVAVSVANYNRDVSVLKSRYDRGIISKQVYNSLLSETSFLYHLSIVSSVITGLSAAFSIPNWASVRVGILAFNALAGSLGLTWGLTTVEIGRYISTNYQYKRRYF